MKKLTFSFLITILSVLPSFARLRLPAIVSDGMVLRSGDARIWGFGTPGDSVTVSPSWLPGDEYITVVDPAGKWAVKVSTGKASDQAVSFDVTDGKSSITVSDVLIGETWLCSGQSNMVFPVGEHTDSLTWQTGMETAEAELKDADYPMLRLFTVEFALSDDRPLDDCKGRWVKATPESVYDFSAVGFVFGRRLVKELGCPVGLVLSAVGATSIESWIDLDIQRDNHIFNQQKWSYSPLRRPEHYNFRVPGTLWHAMIHPIIPYEVTGTIWYQGESNAYAAQNYREQMKILIESWRHERRQPDMPFYYVQIAPYFDRSPYIREAQEQILHEGLGNVGMAVITDAGDSLDVHPRNKIAPGERLARIALVKTYGHQGTAMGPLKSHVEYRGGAAVVYFDNADGLKTPDGEDVIGFVIAGEDGRLYPAKAEINGRKVTVKSPYVDKPCEVRYGFENFPRLNLFNGEGLPASPFRDRK